MYVTSALEHERPFMALLYKFMTTHPRHSVQAVPSYVAFFLRFLAGQVEQKRHHPVRDADLSVVSCPESGCTGISRADWNRRLASVGPSGRLTGPVDVTVVQSGTEARKLAVGVREV